ncbi:hypothetical protein [Bacillus pumilus]|uniref:hypothetical protein n=1 Tax=Bacillus pumilus TaxID=1408 RepID=UPI0011E8D5C8|nr:hypothetical protein [Bacillus pumilus]TYS40549.1 hypothetical protein FZC68_17235 [Bacillus pumilus]
MKKIKINVAFSRGKIKEVEGYFFKIGVFNLVAHKRIDVKGWTVSELSTGVAIYKRTYETRKSCIEEANRLLSKNSIADRLSHYISHAEVINEDRGALT